MVHQSDALDSQGRAVFLSFQNFNFFTSLVVTGSLAATDRWRYRR
jgi:hypothetical protein